MKKILKYTVLSLVLLVTIFYTAYTVTNIRKEYDKNQKEVLLKKSESEKVLDNNFKISLFKGDILEKEDSLSNIKKELNLSDDLTEKDLSEALLTLGYSLEEKTDSDYIYKRDIADSAEPNKYYIKEYEGYLAIFKTDQNGKLYIEDEEKDVYRNSVKFENLPEGDKEMINNLQLSYKTKEEAELDITDMIS